MNEQLDLKSLEKKAYRSLFQDGLWDIYCGGLFSGFSMIYFSRYLTTVTALIIISIWYIVIFILFSLGKKYISIPRMGLVKFGSKRKKNKKMLFLFTIFNTFILVFFLILPFTGLLEGIEINILLLPIIVGVFFIWLPLTIVGLLLDYRRLLLYSFIGGINFIINDMVDIFLNVSIDLFTYGIIGIIIILYGLLLLRRFIREHPLEKLKEVKEEEDE